MRTSSACPSDGHEGRCECWERNSTWAALSKTLGVDTCQTLNHKSQAFGIGSGNDQLRAAGQLYLDRRCRQHSHRSEAQRGLDGRSRRGQLGETFFPEIERRRRDAFLTTKRGNRLPRCSKPPQTPLPLLGFAAERRMNHGTSRGKGNGKTYPLSLPRASSLVVMGAYLGLKETREGNRPPEVEALRTGGKENQGRITSEGHSPPRATPSPKPPETEGVFQPVAISGLNSSDPALTHFSIA
jgi:hypothetical protein